MTKDEKDRLVLRVFAHESRSTYHRFEVTVDIMFLSEKDRRVLTGVTSYPDKLDEYYEGLVLTTMTFSDYDSPGTGAQLNILGALCWLMACRLCVLIESNNSNLTGCL